MLVIVESEDSLERATVAILAAVEDLPLPALRVAKFLPAGTSVAARQIK